MKFKKKPLELILENGNWDVNIRKEDGVTYIVTISNCNINTRKIKRYKFKDANLDRAIYKANKFLNDNNICYWCMETIKEGESYFLGGDNLPWHEKCSDEANSLLK